MSCLTLCCMFSKDVSEIRYRTTTVKTLSSLSRQEQLEKIGSIALHNVEMLLASFKFCRIHNIKSFRVSSNLFPCKTHPQIGYELTDLPHYKNIYTTLKKCGTLVHKNNIRISCHPDKFLILNAKDS